MIFLSLAGVCVVVVLRIPTVEAFAAPSNFGVYQQQQKRQQQCNYCQSSTSLYMAKRKRKKPSMAQRRHKRQGKMRGQNTDNPFKKLPPAKLDFTTVATENEGKGNEKKQKDAIHVANPTAAAEKAKELLKAQRQSVNMLTLVKERIDHSLCENTAAIETLRNQGFAIIDNFLDDESILIELEKEGRRMTENGDMVVDTANLGTGEYITPLQGGEKQYAVCPRMVEFVVSSTKHVPEVFDGEENKIALDTSACMATLRAFDRKALKASLALLTGDDDDGVLDVQEDPSPFDVIATEEDDQRRLSLYYYILPKEWDERCGGGLTFESGVAPAKRDRLVMFYSDSTKCKTIPWKGSDSSTSTVIGNSIELHLVNKQ